jgi:signal transduction histidine kinase
LITAGAGFLNEDSSPIEIVNAKHYIQDGARRCLEMVTNIRTAEESKRELLHGKDLIETLMAQAHLVARQYNVRPSIESLPDRVVILADRGLGHLLWNVMENAIKHNPKQDKQIRISGEFVSDEYFELSIADNGPGMLQDKKDELFNSARRYGGVGIHLVRRLIDKYGGHLIATDCVDGSPDEGLCIKLQFRTTNP